MCVGQVLDLLLEDGDQEVARAAGFDLAAPGAHAQQPEVGRILLAQGDEPVRLEDEGDRDRGVPPLGLAEEEGVDVNSGAVDEVAGRGLDLLDVVRFGELGAQVLLELLALRLGGVEHVDPAGSRQGRVQLLRAEPQLGDPVLVKLEDSQHDGNPGRSGWGGRDKGGRPRRPRLAEGGLPPQRVRVSGVRRIE
jgi:hypothetical protein